MPTPTANTEGPRREDTPREATTQRGTHRHKQKTPRNTTTRTRRYPQPQARTTRGTHTALDGGVCSVARGRESAPLSAQNAQGAPCCLPQPASAGAHFLRASLNKGPPALGVRGWLCLCLRGSLLPPAAKEATALYRDPKVEVWPLRPLCCAGASPLPASNPRPSQPQEPGTEHLQVLSSLPVLLGSKLSPRRSQHRAAWPGPAPGRRVLGAPTCAHALCRATVSSQSLQSARAPQPGHRGSRSLPSRYPGNRLLLPPANQPAPFTWHVSANGRPHHSGPLPGSRALSQARGSERGAGVSTELLLLKSAPWGQGGGQRKSSGPSCWRSSSA